jgi:AcrR family transcriptional regulator
MPKTLDPHTRQRILDKAGGLFYRDGYRAVGVDAIASHTGIAKMTLYRYFPSKDDLIVAYLEKVHSALLAWMDEAARPYPGQPAEQLLAIFRALEKLVTSEACHGCAFLMVSGEYPELDSPGHRAALAHKAAVRAKFEALAAQAGAQAPGVLADGLLLLMDGAFSAARMFGPHNPGASLSQAARRLLEAHSR